MTTDWVAWHAQYDDPASALSQRLVFVQGHLRRAVEACDLSRPVRVVSACAGDGRDVIGVAGELAAGRISARLVELDPSLAARATEAARDLIDVEVVCGDAAATSIYAGAVPADVVLLCGIFGNISEADMEATIHESRCLCAEHATVIWTRHRRQPGVVDRINSWFADAGFTPVAMDAPADQWIGVGVHRLVAAPLPYRPDVVMFTMTGDGR
jgi:hypothetical protein